MELTNTMLPHTMPRSRPGNESLQNDRTGRSFLTSKFVNALVSMSKQQTLKKSIFLLNSKSNTLKEHVLPSLDLERHF